MHKSVQHAGRISSIVHCKVKAIPAISTKGVKHLTVFVHQRSVHLWGEHDGQHNDHPEVGGPGGHGELIPHSGCGCSRSELSPFHLRKESRKCDVQTLVVIYVRKEKGVQYKRINTLEGVMFLGPKTKSVSTPDLLPLILLL